MSFFGVELNNQVNRLILETRLKLSQSKLAHNVRTLKQSLFRLSKNSQQILCDDFEKALNENGIFLKKFEIQAFQKGFSSQKNNGKVDISHFVNALRQPLNKRRVETVTQIFNKLSEGQQQINIDTLKKIYRETGYDNFQSQNHNNRLSSAAFFKLLPETSITLSHFLQLYDDLSVAFPSDEVFQNFVYHQWGIQNRNQKQISPEAVNQIIKAFRYKLIQKTNGTNDQFLLRKVFQKFDQNRNGAIGEFQLDLMLKKLQLPVEGKAISPLLRHLDKNRSGLIEYDEFKRFLFFDPFSK